MIQQIDKSWQRKWSCNNITKWKRYRWKYNNWNEKSLDGLKSILEIAEESISKYEHRTIEMINSQDRKKQKKIDTQRSMGQPPVSQWKVQNENEAEKIFEKITMKNFLNLFKRTLMHNSNNTMNPSRKNWKRIT